MLVVVRLKKENENSDTETAFIFVHIIFAECTEYVLGFLYIGAFEL